MSAGIIGDAERFLRHPRHKRAKWSRQLKCFVVDGHRYEGVRKPLERLFYSDYDSKAAWKKRTASESKQVRAASKTHGTRRGKNLHRQVQIWVECETGVSKRPFRARVKSVHPLVAKVIATFRVLQLRPMRAEQIIYDEQLRMATQIDVFAKHIPTDLVVPIELKFGFDGYVNVATGPKVMDPPLAHWSNSAASQFQLQSLMNGLMLIKCYQTRLAPVGPIVLLANSSGVHVMPLSKRAIADAPIIYRTLQNRAMILKDKRRRSSSSSSKKKKTKTKKRKRLPTKKKTKTSTKPKKRRVC